MAGKIVVINKYQKAPDGYVRIDVTSHNKPWRPYLSPFYLGPVPLPDGGQARVMENAWQFSKVYADMADADGNPTKKFFEWREWGCNESRAHRHPHEGKPLYAYWGGARYGYIDARKHILIPIYYNCVLNNRKGFDTLAQKLSEGYNIALADFDGYDHKAKGMTYEDVVNYPGHVMGHGHILAMMLEDQELLNRIFRGEA